MKVTGFRKLERLRITPRRKEWYSSLTGVQRNFHYSDRIISLDSCLSKKQTITIIQVYAPTGDYSDDVVEEMYDTISKVLNQCESKHRVVMDDFNAKIGMDKHPK